MNRAVNDITTPPIIRIIRPFQAFAENKTSGGVVLLLCTAVALVWSNSAWAESYATLWHTEFAVSLGGRALRHDLHFWVTIC
jgi:Na+:H+ antiporter, NhaA family